MSEQIRYSVLMSLYAGEQPEYLRVSMESMVNQTWRADEIVIVKDGPLTKGLEEVLEEFAKKYPVLFRFVVLEENKGLGLALRQGILACRNEWIARMDTDDASVPARCERQLREIEKQPELDMVCSNYYEFFESYENRVLRISPESHEQILKFARRRNPFGHCCMMYRKSSVLRAGNYREEFPLAEDYDLWIRMFETGSRCWNVQEPLVYVRGNRQFYARRGGIGYWKKIMKFFWKYYREGFFGWKDCVLSCGARTVVCLLPKRLRVLIYRKILRRTNGGGRHA